MTTNESPSGAKSGSVGTTVVNLRNSGYDVYIGRAGRGQAGTFGNPHPIGYCRECSCTHDRAGSIDAFRKYFLRRIVEDGEFRTAVLNLRGKRLGCFCSPDACHGDVIVEWLNDACCEYCDHCHVNVDGSGFSLCVLRDVRLTNADAARSVCFEFTYQPSQSEGRPTAAPTGKPDGFPTPAAKQLPAPAKEKKKRYCKDCIAWTGCSRRQHVACDFFSPDWDFLKFPLPTSTPMTRAQFLKLYIRDEDKDESGRPYVVKSNRVDLDGSGRVIHIDVNDHKDSDDFVQTWETQVLRNGDERNVETTTMPGLFKNGVLQIPKHVLDDLKDSPTRPGFWTKVQRLADEFRRRFPKDVVAVEKAITEEIIRAGVALGYIDLTKRSPRGDFSDLYDISKKMLIDGRSPGFIDRAIDEYMNSSKQDNFIVLFSGTFEPPYKPANVEKLNVEYLVHKFNEQFSIHA